MLTTELTPPKQQTSPPHRILTPPIVKTGLDMPFIADRTFPIPTSTVPGELPPPSPGGRPCTCPRSPTGASKPPPPPRTVSAKSPVEVAKSSQTHEMMTSYSQSSTSAESSHSDSTSPREYSDRFRAPENYRDSNLEEPARRPPEASRRQVPVDHEPQHPEYSMTDTSMGEMKTRSSFEEGCPSVGQSAMETGAVDMLFSYHQMTSDADDGQFSTSTFSSRCSPAVMTSTQPVPSASPRSTVRPTHYYV